MLGMVAFCHIESAVVRFPTITAARVPSTILLSTATTHRVWARFQLAGVKVRTVGDTVAAKVLLMAKVIVMLEF